MACKWNYTIEAIQQFKNVNVTFGGVGKITLSPSTREVRLLKTTGTVTYNCKDIGACKPRHFDLSYDDPPTTELADLTNLYVFNKATAAVAKNLTVVLNQPKLSGTAGIRLVSTNGGACLNVHPHSELTLINGSASYDPPDVPIPGIPYKFPTPPINVNIGTSYSDKLSAEYLLCCCRYDKGLKEFNAETNGIYGRSNIVKPIALLNPFNS